MMLNNWQTKRVRSTLRTLPRFNNCLIFWISLILKDKDIFNLWICNIKHLMYVSTLSASINTDKATKGENDENIVVCLMRCLTNRKQRLMIEATDNLLLDLRHVQQVTLVNQSRHLTHNSNMLHQNNNCIGIEIHRKIDLDI